MRERTGRAFHMAAMALLAALSGCAEYDLRVTEGFATSADLSAAQGSLTAMLLSGMRIEANETGKAKVVYSSGTTNNWFGLVESAETKSLTAEFEGKKEEEEPDGGE